MLPLRAAPFAALAVVALLAPLAGACGKDSHAAARSTDDTATTPAAAPGDCGHAACGSNFFVDATPVTDCAVGAPCNVTLKLVATGQFHINDEYPYKFIADDAPGVEFLGADPAGKKTFSKAASNWEKKDEKSGVMTVAFRASDKGTKAVGGTFKLSVCSPQTCQLEQQHVQASVAVR